VYGLYRPDWPLLHHVAHPLYLGVWQDVLICAEMLVFSIAHAYAFVFDSLRVYIS
jgi:hypothetical protein